MSDLGRYRRIYTRLWAHPAFRQLREGEKLVCVYLLTGPQQNRLGFARLSTAAAAEDLGVSVARFQQRLQAVCEGFGWSFDPATRVLLIPSWWKFNEPANPKHLMGCLSDLGDVPTTPLLADFARCSNALPDKYSGPFLERLREAMGNGIGNGIGKQEQEQEQELVQEQEHIPTRALASLAGGRNGSGATSAANGTGLRERFEAFWKVYPKKVGKDAAWKAWQKRKPSADLTAQICAALAWQKKQDQWLKDGGQYVPNPATWINRGQWQDEPSKTPRVSNRTLSIGRAVEEFLK